MAGQLRGSGYQVTDIAVDPQQVKDGRMQRKNPEAGASGFYAALCARSFFLCDRYFVTAGTALPKSNL